MVQLRAFSALIWARVKPSLTSTSTFAMLHNPLSKFYSVAWPIVKITFSFSTRNCKMSIFFVLPKFIHYKPLHHLRMCSWTCKNMCTNTRKQKLTTHMLRRCNQTRSSNRLKSWSNRLLINFFNPNLKLDLKLSRRNRFNWLQI